ncbi:hypothetical protein B0H10DRAFT_2354442 [Mycena sp. CBHHK59/15]|nr:hypothetical protein B0H10DRAFT_2354442 [Mycena sp. CBHHK59/15]
MGLYRTRVGYGFGGLGLSRNLLAVKLRTPRPLCGGHSTRTQVSWRIQNASPSTQSGVQSFVLLYELIQYCSYPLKMMGTTRTNKKLRRFLRNDHRMVTGKGDRGQRALGRLLGGSQGVIQGKEQVLGIGPEGSWLALFVNVSIAEERRLHPEDSLPLIQQPTHGHSSSLSGAYSHSASSADASALYPYGLYSSDSQVPRAPSPSRSLQGLGSRLPPMIATFGTMDGHNGDHRRAHNQYSPGSELPPIRSFDAGGSYSNSS